MGTRSKRPPNGDARPGAATAERTEEAEKDAEKAKDVPKKEAAEIEKERAELEKARAEVRTLQQQLRQALAGGRNATANGGAPRWWRSRGARRGDAPSARVAPSDEQPSNRGEASPRSPRSPNAPVPPVAPRRVAPPAAPRRPQVERDGERSPGGQSDYDRRLRDLDNKLEELLKKVKELKDEQKPQASKVNPSLCPVAAQAHRSCSELGSSIVESRPFGREGLERLG